jgi:TetR/AcrR family transcriptional repressor of nem operon
MARPREFDMDEATERAMALFWSGGYEDVSLADLLEGMQLSRGSLYKAYGEKHAVWLAALDLYDHQVVQPTAAALSDVAAGSGLVRVARFLDGPAAAVRTGNDRRGCFLCNAAVDRAAADGDTRDRVLSMLLKIESGVRRALTDAAAEHEWSALVVDKKSKTTLAVYVGLRVLVRAGTPLETIDTITTAHLETLLQP